jgi:Tfp pilus assembly protein PilX
MTMAIFTAIKDFLLRERTLGPSRIDQFRSAAQQGSESPCGEGPPCGCRKRAPARRKRVRQRGVALVAVMIAIAITLVISNEFGTSTNGDLMAAANYRDQMRSHFLARSALNMSELVIRVQQRIDNVQQLRDAGIRITDFADQVLLAFCGTSEEVQAAIGLSSTDTKGLGADIGTCGITGQIGTDDDKLNLNCANGNVQTTSKYLKSELDALIYFPAYDPVFEDPDADGYRRDRATQAAAIVDYIDGDSQRVHEFGTTEDYGYENLKDRYRPKNNYIDTLGELRLVRGVDDRFWTLFGPAFTVYGGCKVNISAVSNTQLIAAILYLSVPDKLVNVDPVLKDPAKLFALARLVAMARQFGMIFTKPEDFAAFVKDPVAQLSALAGKPGDVGADDAANALTGPLAQITGGQKLGLELDLAKLKQIVSAGPRRTYRVEAWGEIERKQKNADGSPVYPAIRSTITGVWDTRVVPQNVRKPPVPKGAWVFQRED